MLSRGPGNSGYLTERVLELAGFGLLDDLGEGLVVD